VSLKGFHFKGKLLNLPANETKAEVTIAFYGTEFITSVKFYSNVLKPIFDVEAK
jgi:hypothetical protein